MNDFLQSIRNGSYAKDNGSNSKPRYSNNGNNQRTRRSYETNGNYLRNNNDRKFRSRQTTDNLPSEDTLTTIKDTLQAILANQEATIAVSERKAIAEERKADAFEFIAQHIGKIIDENFVFSKYYNRTDEAETTQEGKEEAFSHDTEHIVSTGKKENVNSVTMDKGEILNIITSMRQDGATYSEIAAHLDELNLPTFSGRGKWHAQTIHRLCQTV